MLELVQNRDYFVLTTNVDHQFQRAGFEKQRLFYTQGDYSLWQCSRPYHQNIYDNEVQARQMLAKQKGMRILSPELGVGGNTPVIIKYPFWKLAEENPKAAYACVNLQDAFAPRELAPRSLCIQRDIGQTLDDLASPGIS